MLKREEKKNEGKGGCEEICMANANAEVQKKQTRPTPISRVRDLQTKK